MNWTLGLILANRQSGTQTNVEAVARAAPSQPRFVALVGGARNAADLARRMAARNQAALVEGRRALELSKRRKKSGYRSAAARSSNEPPRERYPVIVRGLTCVLTVDGQIEPALEGAVDAAIERTRVCISQWYANGCNDIRPVLRININSRGGAIAPAMAAYEHLRRVRQGPHAIGVHTHITGDAFSAAGVLAMAGNLRTAAGSARFLVHRPHFPGQPRPSADARNSLEKLWGEIGQIYWNESRDQRRILGIGASGMAESESMFDAATALYLTVIDEIL